MSLLSLRQAWVKILIQCPIKSENSLEGHCVTDAGDNAQPEVDDNQILLSGTCSVRLSCGASGLTAIETRRPYKHAKIARVWRKVSCFNCCQIGVRNDEISAADRVLSRPRAAFRSMSL